MLTTYPLCPPQNFIAKQIFDGTDDNVLIVNIYMHMQVVQSGFVL